MNKKIVIFSEDRRFSRMLELELNSLGIEVTTSDKFAENIYNELCVIIDLDTVEMSELHNLENSDTVIYFSKNEEHYFEYTTLSHSVFFKRPFPMSDFLGVFKNSKTNYDTKTKYTPTLQSKSLLLTVNDTEKAALWGDIKIPLSDNEYRVLSYLYENRGNVVDRITINSILNAQDGNIGDVYICHLRKKIDNMLGIKLIYTIHSKGYMLKY